MEGFVVEPRIEAVTLDLFGTLLDFSIERDEPPLVRRLLDELDEPREEGPVLDRWLHASLEERGRRPFRTVTQALVVGARRTGAQLDLDLDPERWARSLEALWARRPLHDDVPRGLDRLRNQGLSLALVSNLDAHVLDEVLERTGLEAWLDAVVCSEHARAYKPHPRPFQLALEALGVGPARAAHIGDSTREDGPGAQAAGMTGWVWVGPDDGGFTGAVDRLLARQWS